MAVWRFAGRQAITHGPPGALVELDAVSKASAMAVVFASGSWLEAEMIACALDGHGVPAVILDGNICRLYPCVALLVGGAKVVVDQRDEEQAIDVLGLLLPGSPPFAGSFVSVPLSLAARR